MFPYYGRKKKLAPLYPSPKFDLIIEPFAGSAAYSTLHYRHAVLLVDKYPEIIKVWQYLQSASRDAILGLPKPGHGEDLRNYQLDERGERQLVSYLIAAATSYPQFKVGRYNNIHRDLQRLALDLYKIQHWVIREGDYRDIPNQPATWFIDPPYFAGGHKYKFGNRGFDYIALAEWCRSRQGQVIVCENDQADWLPFKPLTKLRGAFRATQEVWWTNEQEAMDTAQGYLFPPTGGLPGSHQNTEER